MPKESLRVWIMPTQVGPKTSQHFVRAIAPFRKAHPRQTVELRVLPWSIAWGEILRAFKRGEPPDVLQVGSTWLGTLGHLGYLDEVPSGLVGAPPVAGWLSQAARFDTRELGVPWVVEPSGLIAREDILERRGLTPAALSDWEGFLAFCGELAGGAVRDEIDPNRPLPLGITCRPEPVTLHNMAPWLWSGGWKLSEQLGRGEVLSHPSARPGLEFLGSLLRANRTDEDSGAVQPYRLALDFYQEGRFAFLLAHPWMIVRRLIDPTASMESRWPVTFLPIPAGPAGAVSRAGGSLLSVSRHCARKELAWDLVRFLASDAFMDTWILASGDVPAHRGSFWLRHGEHPEVARLRAAVETARSYPAHPMWATIEKVLAVGLNEILWSLLSGNPFEEHGLARARETDLELSSILSLAWDLPA